MLPFVCESSAGFAGVSSVVVAEILLRLLQQCSETLLKERERETNTHTHSTAVNLELSTAAFEELAEELLQLCSLLLTSSRIRVVCDISCLFLHPFVCLFLPFRAFLLFAVGKHMSTRAQCIISKIIISIAAAGLTPFSLPAIGCCL
jgi:hypothetical protein